MYEVRFNAKRMHARIMGDVLVVEMPTAPMQGPIIAEEVRAEFMDRGLTAREVDQLIDDWYDQLQNRLLIKHIESCKL